ncbi:annexin D8-like [Cucurbita maxima]|uniref:Annexin D8-like n=1 Tax=Cucurbita maxima TaxID=3661 RepID=A0A6J1IDP6_CUCMA|nr:annexin D8-like [Cucurbita maxima]
MVHIRNQLTFPLLLFPIYATQCLSFAIQLRNMSINTDLEKDCIEIHDSWDRRSNNLVRVLATRNLMERQQMRKIYKAIYGEELVERLGTTNVKELVPQALSLWMLDPHERDAVLAREALEQGDTNYKALIEIFVGRKSSQIFLIKQSYQARYQNKLEQDIINIDPPHSYQKILVALAASHKAHNADVSQHIAKCDARRLYETVKDSLAAIEEEAVLEMLTKRSIPQLKLTFSCYQHIFGHNFTKALKLRNCGEFENVLRTIVKCICNPPKYYAKVVYKSIKGEENDNGALRRVLVSRAEVDLDEIQRAFKGKYGIQLRGAIHESIFCEDYRDFLVALAIKTTY